MGDYIRLFGLLYKAICYFRQFSRIGCSQWKHWWASYFSIDATTNLEQNDSEMTHINTSCVALSVGSTLFVTAGEMVAVAMLLPDDITSPSVHGWLVVFSVSTNDITVLLLSVSFHLL